MIGRGTLPLLALPLVSLLGGCSSIGAVTGAVAGASTGAATANPIVGYATAVSVNAGISALQKHITRVRQRKEQNRIAEAAGGMAPGEATSWKVAYINPFFANHHGELQVLRDIDTPLTRCKEVLFTLDTGRPPRLSRTPYTTDICRDAQGWKWAMAEPAIRRWGYLQHISR
ncbi:MAG TPA: hypothetical protein VFN77_12130 [Acetobacteraceae bacterium]|nr:hypothetical protein [Acetobacteraceae bacterium]